jgi:hypothetical protein
VLVVEPGQGEKPHRLRFREVWVLRLVGDEAIVSRGLEAGDLVCVSPLETPTDGMVVRVSRQETEGVLSDQRSTRELAVEPPGPPGEERP